MLVDHIVNEYLEHVQLQYIPVLGRFIASAELIQYSLKKIKVNTCIFMVIICIFV